MKTFIFKKQTTLLLIFTLSLLAGCAGKTPYPVQTYQVGDEQLTCSQIENLILQNQQKTYKLYPKTQKTGKNVALGVAGAFLIVPWFFMDFSDAERIEIEALERRDQYLHSLAVRKQCYNMPPKMKLVRKRR